MLRQPTEVLEHVVDELDQREDLLSLALTCGRLRDLILAEHLPYRRIVVSVYFKPFFDLILTRSDLAKRVRELYTMHEIKTRLLRASRARSYSKESAKTKDCTQLLWPDRYDNCMHEYELHSYRR